MVQSLLGPSERAGTYMALANSRKIHVRDSQYAQVAELASSIQELTGDH
jgi:hypothetical protein